MAPILLYSFSISPPCRAVFSTAEILGVELKEKNFDLFKGEHLTEDFLKLNPHHKVPTITDGDYSIGESRAIQLYLFNKFAKPEHDHLYPKDVQKRGRVDWLLNYDATTLFPNALSYFKAYRFAHRKPSEEETKNLLDSLDQLNNFYFRESDYFIGNELTLADISIVATLTFLDMIHFDFSKWGKIAKLIQNSRETAWFKKGPAEYEQLASEWTNLIKEKGLL